MRAKRWKFTNGAQRPGMNCAHARPPLLCPASTACVWYCSSQAWARVLIRAADASMPPSYRKAHCAVSVSYTWWLHLVWSVTQDREPLQRLHCVSQVSKRSSIFVFGGVDDRPKRTKPAAYFDETWHFDFLDKSWRKLIVTGAIPAPRAHAAMSRVADSAIMFGGFDGVCQLQDLHVLHLQALAWSTPVLSGPPLLPRDRHSVRTVSCLPECSRSTSCSPRVCLCTLIQMTAVGGLVILFGGRTPTPSQPRTSTTIVAELRVIDTQVRLHIITLCRMLRLPLYFFRAGKSWRPH